MKWTMLLLVGCSAIVGCGNDQSDFVEKDRARFEKSICSLNNVSEIEKLIPAEGFTYSVDMKSQKLTGIKHYSVGWGDVVASSLSSKISMDSKGLPVECSVEIVLTGP